MELYTPVRALQGGPSSRVVASGEFLGWPPCVPAPPPARTCARLAADPPTGSSSPRCLEPPASSTMRQRSASVLEGRRFVARRPCPDGAIRRCFASPPGRRRRHFRHFAVVDSTGSCDAESYRHHCCCHHRGCCRRRFQLEQERWPRVPLAPKGVSKTLRGAAERRWRRRDAASRVLSALPPMRSPKRGLLAPKGGRH